MNQSVNPLRQFFRQPAIYMKLPSDGQFWPPGSLDMPVNRELPILPMTAIDEISYRTPDALFNGAAVTSVIKSCVPNIKDPWKIPSIDLNSLLIAIRIASYGHGMEINSTCPACNTTNEFELDLRSVMAQVESPDYSSTIKYNDIEIFFHPITYDVQNDINLKQFEQQRLIQLLPGSDLPDDEKSQRLTEAVKAITDITVMAIQNSIAGIRTPQAMVTESGFILEFLNNCDRKLFTIIRDHIVNMRTKSDLKPLHIVCTECKHEYDQDFTLDTASFFAAAS